MTVAVIDVDYIKYAAAGVGETRSIVAIHKQSGREHSFANRTEFWGRGKNKNGGWLAELNKGRTSPFLPEEFEIVDVQTPEPIENVLHTAKMMFEANLKALDTTKYIGLVGKGDSFRVERSTLLKYKGQRSALLKSLYLDDVTEYLIKKFKLKIIEHLEVDDVAVIECYKKKDHVLVGVDKDYMGCPVLVYNPNHPELGVQNCNQFGKLWVDSKGKVRGIGRLFFYFQVASSDKIDNYAANSVSTKRWGDKNAYDKLSKCKTDYQALIAVKEIYQWLYPSPLEITGWRGDKFTIDWLYVASENWTMARMLRTFEELEDEIKLTHVLARLEII